MHYSRRAPLLFAKVGAVLKHPNLTLLNDERLERYARCKAGAVIFYSTDACTVLKMIAAAVRAPRQDCSLAR